MRLVFCLIWMACWLTSAAAAAPEALVDTDDTDDTDIAVVEPVIEIPVVRAVPNNVVQPRLPPPIHYEGPPLVVGIKPTPPFAFKGDDGRWRGVSVELWTVIAEDAGIPWELRELPDLGALLEALDAGEVDVALGALTVTAEREVHFDFSHPFHDTGYGIAVRQKAGSWMWLTRLVSPTFWKIVAGLLALLLVVGALVWIAERRANPEEFGGTLVHGLANGLWWSAVTMTTVGYGDKSPRTFFGRGLALVWMFSSLLVISSTTAAITTSLTVSKLDLGIAGPEDLAGHTVGSVSYSTSVQWLEDHHMSVQTYETADHAMEALADGEVDAVVYDASILRYLVKARGEREVTVVSDTFGRQAYAIGVRQGAPYLEVVNRALLHRLETRWWDDVVFRYTGE